MIGEIEALLDESVDIYEPMFSGALARMQQHILDDSIRPLAMLHDLFEIAPQRVAFSPISARRFVVEVSPEACRNSSISSTETAEKLLTKLSGFLISCAMPAVS